MNSRHLVALVALVFLPALSIRLYPVTSESFQHDTIVSQVAAADGVAANAWDRPDTYENRRFHPPLLSYVIMTNNAVFGDDEYRARLFSIIAGALACLVVAISIYAILGNGTMSLAGAVFGGWMVGLLPVQLYVSRTANWDGLYSLLSACTLLGLCLHFKTPRLRTLVWTGGPPCGLPVRPCCPCCRRSPLFSSTIYGGARRVRCGETGQSCRWSL